MKKEFIMGTKNQVYTIPTFDAAFKWILDLDSIRPSFFHAFIPDFKVESSVRADDHLQPIQALQLLREFVHDDKTQKIVDQLIKTDTFEVHTESKKKLLECNKSATEFLN